MNSGAGRLSDAYGELNPGYALPFPEIRRGFLKVPSGAYSPANTGGWNFGVMTAVVAEVDEEVAAATVDNV